MRILAFRFLDVQRSVGFSSKLMARYPIEATGEQKGTFLNK